MITKREENEKIYILADYNKDFINRIKKIGGRWNPDTKEWALSLEQEESVNEILYDVFGYIEGREEELIRIEYCAKDFLRGGDVYVGSICMASRKYRASNVFLKNETVIIKGGFPERSGTNQKGTANPEEGTVLRSNVSKGVYEQLSEEQKAKIKIITEKERKKESLIEEKKQLLKRLEEIEKELEQ